jgi:hypothetical protein
LPDKAESIIVIQSSITPYRSWEQATAQLHMAFFFFQGYGAAGGYPCAACAGMASVRAK